MAIITVSREYGSCGEEIAQQVAQRLGYSYFDKELLADVARAANTKAENIAPYDEKDEHSLHDFLKKLFTPDISKWVELPYYYPPSLPMERSLYPDETVPAAERQPAPDAEKVVAFTREVIEKLGSRGNVVIVGRGSQKILADRPDTLHICFIGSVGVRSQHVMERAGVTYAEALKKIQEIDRLRAHYLHHYYDADWMSPLLYHLVLNTGLMTMEQTVEVVITAVRHQESK